MVTTMDITCVEMYTYMIPLRCTKPFANLRCDLFILFIRIWFPKHYFTISLNFDLSHLKLFILLSSSFLYPYSRPANAPCLANSAKSTSLKTSHQVVSLYSSSFLFLNFTVPLASLTHSLKAVRHVW